MIQTVVGLLIQILSRQLLALVEADVLIRSLGHHEGVSMHRDEVLDSHALDLLGLERLNQLPIRVVLLGLPSELSLVLDPHLPTDWLPLLRLGLLLHGLELSVLLNWRFCGNLDVQRPILVVVLVTRLP